MSRTNEDYPMTTITEADVEQAVLGWRVVL